ncbi:MAG: hypothetical protein JWO20_275 [Candidatus Angelobacter sp.]|nr:hypothetical protein [Candidatus Angelobacter sp.]
MRSTLIRTAAVTSLVTALVVSAMSYYVMPKLQNLQSNNETQLPADQAYTGVTLQPAAYNGPAQPYYGASHVTRQPQVVRRSSAPVANSSSVSQRDSYGEPVRQKRSTEKSVLIVAGSSGAGAAIGGLAAGGKGAGIGAIAGGVAGLIYDRATANPK